MAINKLKKQEIIVSYEKGIDSSEAIFFMDTSGLTVYQLEIIRDKIKSIGGEYKLIKNTLFKRVLVKNNSSNTLLDLIYGYNSVVFAPNNSNIFAKEILNFSKELGIEIKFGILNNNLIDKNMILDLASIDSIEVLILKLIYILNGNLENLVNSLSFSAVSLINVLNSIKNTKEEGVK